MGSDGRYTLEQVPFDTFASRQSPFIYAYSKPSKLEEQLLSEPKIEVPRTSGAGLPNTTRALGVIDILESTVLIPMLMHYGKEALPGCVSIGEAPPWLSRGSIQPTVLQMVEGLAQKASLNESDYLAPCFHFQCFSYWAIFSEVYWYIGSFERKQNRMFDRYFFPLTVMDTSLGILMRIGPLFVSADSKEGNTEKNFQ